LLKGDNGGIPDTSVINLAEKLAARPPLGLRETQLKMKGLVVSNNFSREIKDFYR
jgi:hypothetical protein